MRFAHEMVHVEKEQFAKGTFSGIICAGALALAVRVSKVAILAFDLIVSSALSSGQAGVASVKILLDVIPALFGASECNLEGTELFLGACHVAGLMLATLPMRVADILIPELETHGRLGNFFTEGLIRES
jgi:hypothetical protein